MKLAFNAYFQVVVGIGVLEFCPSHGSRARAGSCRKSVCTSGRITRTARNELCFVGADCRLCKTWVIRPSWVPCAKAKLDGIAICDHLWLRLLQERNEGLVGMRESCQQTPPLAQPQMLYIVARAEHLKHPAYLIRPPPYPRHHIRSAIFPRRNRLESVWKESDSIA